MGSADKGVVAGPGDHRRKPAARGEEIMSAAAEQGRVARAGPHRLVTGAALEKQLTLAAVHSRRTSLDHRVVARAQKEQIIAGADKIERAVTALMNLDPGCRVDRDVMARVDRVVTARNRYRAVPRGVAGVIDGPVTGPADHDRLSVSRQIDRLLTTERGDNIISALQVDDVVTLTDDDSETIAVAGLDQIVAVAGNDRSVPAGGVVVSFP